MWTNGDTVAAADAGVFVQLEGYNVVDIAKVLHKDFSALDKGTGQPQQQAEDHSNGLKRHAATHFMFHPGG